MASTALIAARVEAGIKQRFQMLAAHQGTTESALLKRMVEFSLQAVTPESTAQVLSPRKSLSRNRRITVRLRIDDRRLLVERAAARKVAPATYVALVMHTHLYGVAPVPEEELKAVKSSLKQLAAARHYLRLLVQAARYGKLAGPKGEELAALYKVLDTTHARIKALLVANLKSWQTDNE